MLPWNALVSLAGQLGDSAATSLSMLIKIPMDVFRMSEASSHKGCVSADSADIEAYRRFVIRRNQDRRLTTPWLHKFREDYGSIDTYLCVAYIHPIPSQGHIEGSTLPDDAQI